jgi:hypothetical protein
MAIATEVEIGIISNGAATSQRAALKCNHDALAADVLVGVVAFIWWTRGGVLFLL